MGFRALLLNISEPDPIFLIEHTAPERMARIVKTGSKYKVVNSVNGRTVKGGSGLTKAQAEKKKNAVVKKTCGLKHQRCKG